MMDMEPMVPLEALDPGTGDPGYWSRFHDSVMRSAGPALALRRQARRVTIAEVLAAWSRLVVPVSVMAAALLAFVIVTLESESERPMPLLGIEEFLAPVWEDRAEPLPAFLHSESPPDRDAVLFAVEGF